MAPLLLKQKSACKKDKKLSDWDRLPVVLLFTCVA